MHPLKNGVFNRKMVLALYPAASKGQNFFMPLILIILLILLFCGGGGYYGYSTWGPVGGGISLGTILVIVLVLYLLKVI